MGGPDRMNLCSTVAFVRTLYDQLHILGNWIAKIHSIMQSDICADAGKGTPSMHEQCHGLAETMLFYGFMGNMSSGDEILLHFGRKCMALFGSFRCDVMKEVSKKLKCVTNHINFL